MSLIMYSHHFLVVYDLFLAGYESVPEIDPFQGNVSISSVIDWDS
jgi:hypothetical protein